ncbi:hypothetical protein [Jannaschia faecimaris]|uniref:hypothetical protein n=1 Tax=Jannaschia faecimaris TaxID=1244108 RepID=UPI0011139B70|nr:hypothetical protein [Jannaschia faecimaris]
MKNWWFLGSHVASIVFALFSAFISWWLPWRASIIDARIVEVAKSSALDFTTPLPWLGVIVFLWILSVVKSHEFRQKVRDFEKLSDNYDLLETDYYEETEGHRETKESYYASLRSSLRYILTQTSTGFSERCRVTVYRLHDADTKMFRNIFRHAPQHRFNEPGRDAIPVSEGVVGLAYATSALQNFRSEEAFGSEEYVAKLENFLESANIKNPRLNTRMPSQQIVCKTISDLNTGFQVGVVVYECMDPDALNVDGIMALLTQEDQNISRFVSHLAVLDADFNPFPHDAYPMAVADE